MRPLRTAAVTMALAGALCLGQGLYIPAKAAAAQVLLRLAWARTGATPARPWPWAHTWPVARLLVPRMGIDEIVLAGAEGAALAFAPGHVDGSAAPGEPGNVVLAGHRDTVFRFLRELRLGDELWLETGAHRRRRFVVRETAVVHEDDTRVLAPARDVLTLVTCYPFDAVRPGGPLRYVVRAEAAGVTAGPPSAGRQQVAGRTAVTSARARSGWQPPSPRRPCRPRCG